jgi:hypothetical protein
MLHSVALLGREHRSHIRDTSPRMTAQPVCSRIGGRGLRTIDGPAAPTSPHPWRLAGQSADLRKPSGREEPPHHAGMPDWADPAGRPQLRETDSLYSTGASAGWWSPPLPRSRVERGADVIGGEGLGVRGQNCALISTPHPGPLPTLVPPRIAASIVGERERSSSRDGRIRPPPTNECTPTPPESCPPRESPDCCPIRAAAENPPLVRRAADCRLRE